MSNATVLASATALPNRRRAFLQQLAALPLIGGGLSIIGQPTATAEPASPSEETLIEDADGPLYQLGYELLVATVGYSEKTGEALDAAYEAAAEIVDRVIDLPAATIGGLRVKALALRWCYAFEPIDLLGDHGGTADVHVLDSIVRDLLAPPA